MTIEQVMDQLVERKILSDGAAKVMLWNDELEFLLTDDFGKPTELLNELLEVGNLVISHDDLLNEYKLKEIKKIN